METLSIDALRLLASAAAQCAPNTVMREHVWRALDQLLAGDWRDLSSLRTELSLGDHAMEALFDQLGQGEGEGEAFEAGAQGA